MTRTAQTIQLDIIGAGPAYTDRPGAVGAAYLVRTGDTAIVLDLGHGAFAGLARAIEPSTLDAVVISHLHPDHFIDLVALRHYLRWEFDPVRRVRVVAPADLGRRIDALHDDPGFTAASLDVEPVAEGPMTIGSFRIDARRVTHTRDSHAYRIAHEGTDRGPGLVYSGDCGRAEDLDPLIRAGDTLLCEVSFGPGPVPHEEVHLDGPSVGALAARTGAGRVLLTHLQMGYEIGATIESVRARYDGPVALVAPGEQHLIGG